MADTHETHKMRGSDSSQYDEICDNCMEPDWCTHTNPKLELPCKAEVCPSCGEKH